MSTTLEDGTATARTALSEARAAATPTAKLRQMGQAVASVSHGLSNADDLLQAGVLGILSIPGTCTIASLIAAAVAHLRPAHL